MATHSSILAWRVPMDRGAWKVTIYGVTKSRTQLAKRATHTHTHITNNLHKSSSILIFWLHPAGS